MNRWKTLEDFVGNTPLVQLKRIPGEENARRNNVILAKLEGNNPAGSVKDRPALSMITHAEARGRIKPGDTLIEATSGNTGIALAMAAAMRGYRMILIMPENQSVERLPDHEGLRCRTGADAEGGEHGRRARLAERHGARRARASCSTSSPIRTIRWRTTKAPGRRSGATPTGASPISFPAWAPPAPSWAARATSRKQIRRFGSSAASPKRARRFRASASGRMAYLPKIYDFSRVDRLEYVGPAGMPRT